MHPSPGPIQQEPPVAPETGQVLGGRYRLQEELGRGGMGQVFAALDTELKRRVAIKLIGSAAPTDVALARFRQEARALAVFNHPNILAIHDVGEEGDFPYLVCELLEGATLREKLAGASLSIGEAVEVAAQIAAGLAAAHERQIIHRDLKPSNVFLTRDGAVKLIDFGIAKLAATPATTASLSPGAKAPPEPAATLDGNIVGTEGYMAPEQLRGESLDARADLFSFGAVLYEMVAARPAFTRGPAHDTSEAVLARPPPPLPKRVPASLRHIIERCLEKEPARRYASAAELLRELEKARAALPRKGRRRLQAVGAAALLAAAGAAILWHGRAREGPLAVTLAPVEADAAAAPVAAALDAAFDRALAVVPGLVRLRPLRAAAGGGPSNGWTLRSSLAREGSRLRLLAQLESGDRKLGEPVEAVGSAAELEAQAAELGTRVRDELLPLWRDHLRRDRAHRLSRSSAAGEKLDAYYDLMGAAPRLEFLGRGRKLLDEALAADPAYVPALAERSQLLRLAAGLDNEDAAADLRLARASADEALRLAPRDPEALLAECLVARLQTRDLPTDRELDAATSACSDAAQADPQSAQALYALAQLYDQSCQDSQLIETLKLAVDRASRYDTSRAMVVSFYLVSVALQRNHLQEAEAFSSQLLAREAEEDRLAPARRAARPRLQGVHVLRAAVLLRLRRDGEAAAQLEAEVARGATAVGGLDETVEAACLRGLAAIARRSGSAPEPARAARLAALEKQFLAQDAGSNSPSVIAGWYGFVDPGSAAAWLDQLKEPEGCGLSLPRAVIYGDAGRAELAARALGSCHAAEQWARRCVRVIADRLKAAR